MARFSWILCLSGAILGVSSEPSFAARPMYLRVSLNGEVILEGTDSDGGTRDADEIWEDLKKLQLRETGAFYKLDIAPNLQEYTIDIPYAENKPFPLEIDSMFGGTVTTRVLTIKRVTPDSWGGTWIIDSEDLDRLFDDRRIRRSEVRVLKNPKFAGETGEWLQQREEYERARIQRNYNNSFLFGILIGAGGLSTILYLYDFISRIRRDGFRPVSTSES